MAPGKVTLYVDTVSPFAYLAYYILRRSPAFKECDVSYVPMFLGGVMKYCNNTPPINIKNKDKWIDLERLRWAKHYNIPLGDKVPEGFPINTLAVQRALCALTIISPEKITTALDALYDAIWVKQDIPEPHKPEGLAKILAATFGEELATKIMKESTSDGAKKMLSGNTDEAIKEGAFGLPYFVVTNAKGETERFWGFDHLGLVLNHLGVSREKLDPKVYQAMM